MMSTVMMERAGMGMASMGPTGMATGGMARPYGDPAGVNWLMVPRCTYKVEKCMGGFKINCICDDKMACSMMQNLCTMLAGGMCSCCCMMNGMVVCNYNFTMCSCKCEMTDKGCCITCTSGDKNVAEMLQACCESLTTMLKCGCTCCVMLNNTPIGCGCC